MKRLLSLLCAVAMLFLLAACDSKKADKYCTNCGAGLTQSDAFCHECGTAVGGEASPSSTDDVDESTTTTTTTTAPTTTITTTTTTAPTTTITTTAKLTTTTKAKPTTTKKKTTEMQTTTLPNHKKTTAKPTPTKKTTTAHKHTYSKYVCTGCGKIDKDHSYEYLVEWLKQNGETNGAYINYPYWSGKTLYTLTYGAQSGSLSIAMIFESEGEQFYSALYLDDYEYYCTLGEGQQLTGYVKAKDYTQNTPISYTNYKGNSSMKNDFIELTRTSICDLLDWFSWLLESEDVGITLADLGFLSFE